LKVGRDGEGKARTAQSVRWIMMAVVWMAHYSIFPGKKNKINKNNNTNKNIIYIYKNKHGVLKCIYFLSKKTKKKGKKERVKKKEGKKGRNNNNKK
jgi:hypothetical protein